MDICSKIKSILSLNRIQIKDFAETLNNNTGTKKYNAKNLSAKLLRDGISFKEAEMMPDILGYDVRIIER